MNQINREKVMIHLIYLVALPQITTKEIYGGEIFCLFFNDWVGRIDLELLIREKIIQRDLEPYQYRFTHKGKSIWKHSGDWLATGEYDVTT